MSDPITDPITAQLLDDIWEMLYQERGRLVGRKINLRQKGQDTDEIRVVLAKLAKLMRETDFTMTALGMPARYISDEQ